MEKALSYQDIRRAWDAKDSDLADLIVTLAQGPDAPPAVPPREGARTFAAYLSEMRGYPMRQKPKEEQAHARIEGMKALEAPGAEVPLPDRLQLHEVILDLWKDGGAFERETLLAVVRRVPLRWGPWRAMKRIFKEAEARGDWEMLGALGARFDAAYAVGGAYQGEISRKTLAYLVRRTWRGLRRRAETLPASYPDAAVELLRFYGNDTRWVSTWAYNHVVFHETKKYTRRQFKIDRRFQNLLQYRAYSDLWRRTPRPLFTLLERASADQIRSFAIAALKADFRASLREVEPTWVARLINVRSQAVDEFVVWLLANVPRFEQGAFRELGLHAPVLSLFDSPSNEARAYAAAYARTHARDLSLDELYRLANNTSEDVRKLSRDLLHDRDPRKDVGLDGWGRLLGTPHGHDLAAAALRKHFGARELTPEWLKERLLSPNNQVFELGAELLGRVHTPKALGAGYFRDLLDDARLTAQAARFAIDNLSRFPQDEIGIDFLKRALVHPLTTAAVTGWVEEERIKAKDLGADLLKALAYKPTWETDAWVNELKGSGRAWARDLGFSERLSTLALKLLSDVRRFSPSELGFDWLMQLAGRSEKQYADFAVEYMIKAFVPADFAPKQEAPPPAAAPKAKQAADLKGQSFLFTGKLATMQRSEATKKVTGANGKNASGVNPKLDYLVIGDDGSPLYGAGRKGSKQLDAEKLIGAGAPIKIISETAFLQMLAGEQRTFSGDSVNAGAARLWTLATEPGPADAPLRVFALQYLRRHHPDISLALTDRPVDPGAEVPADFLSFERVKPLFLDARDPIRELALDLARWELARWKPPIEAIVELCESPHAEVREFLAKALTAGPSMEHARYRVDPATLTADAVYSFCESLDAETRALGMKLIGDNPRLAIPEELFRLTESPDRQVRAFVIKTIWSLYRDKGITGHWKPAARPEVQVGKKPEPAKKGAPKDEGKVAKDEGPPKRPEGRPASDAALRDLVRRVFLTVSPGRLPKVAAEAGKARKASKTRPLPARKAKLGLIEVIRDLAVEDAAFAAIVRPLFAELSGSIGPSERAACLVALTRIDRAHPSLVERQGRSVTVENQDKFVPFRGALRAAIGQGQVLAFVTVHPEGQQTAVYRLDLDKMELASDALPGGAVALAEADDQLFAAGTDGKIHRGPLAGGALSPIGEAFDPAPSALAVLSEGRLAVLSGAAIAIVDRKSGKVLQRLPLAEAGTALAADATGIFLAAGTSRGVLAVFDCEEKKDFLAAESKKIHDGAISALLFDPDELRVYSAGSDNKLLLTHARGELEPEDRSGGAAHDGIVQALCIGVEDKLYSAGKDGTLKTWARGPQKRRPSTLKDGVGSGVALARVTWKGRPHLALLAEDQTIRLFPLDAGGKVNERALVIRDAYALAEHEFEAREPERREAALRTLSGYNDGKAIEILGKRAGQDPDVSLRALSTKLLGASGNPRANKLLEGLLGAGEEQVRRAALDGLRALEGQAALRPLELALGVNKRDVGVAAVEALTALGKSDDQAMARLVRALDDDPVEVRAAALAGLEQLHDAASPEASLIALRSRRPDIRRLALVRCFQRKLLDRSEVGAALRKHEGDSDADVRRTAFLVAVMSRPALGEALAGRDRDLGRQLDELSTFGQKVEPAAEGEAGEKAEKTEKVEAKPAKGKKAKAAEKEPEAKPSKGEAKSAPALTEADLRPLLEAMASRALDTCLLGARGLAALQDERAFGTLLQLTNERSAPARVEACKALAELGDPRGVQRLRQMLRDGDGAVRDAAFSALSRLLDKGPLDAAEAGLLAPQEDVRGRALQLLARQLKKDPPKKLEGRAVELLSRALSDPSASLGSEAFKIALNLEVGGGGAGTLRFALGSMQASVRREVLGEVMGRIQEPWAPGLLHEIFADPDAGVRAEAFEASQKRSKGRAIEPLAAAIEGKHTDLKLKAIEILGKRKVEGAGSLLLKAIGDEDDKVRIAAVDALLPEEAAEAMASERADVRVRAAQARAAYGDTRALAPLLALAAEKEPELAEKREAWIDRTSRALRGLGELGDPGALAAVSALATHKEKRIAQAALEALGWIARPGGDVGALRAALSLGDADLRLEAALGLARVADGAALPLVKGLVQTKGASAQRGLSASLTLGAQAGDLFMAYLDHDEEPVRRRALVLMMLVESSEQDGVPDRCLAALSSAHPRTRMVAARALESFADPADFSAFVAWLLNDRGDDHAAWTIGHDVVRALAEIAAFGDPQLKARMARLLDALDDEKQDRFDRTYAVFQKRFAASIKELVASAAKRKPAAPEYAPEELRRVVLGAYAGLSRQIGGALEVRVRQTALGRLTAMAKADAKLKETVQSLLLLSLGDPTNAVRKLGFDSLSALGMPAAELGAEALAVGHRDMGVAGLGLLAESGDRASKEKVLTQVLLGNTDGLEEEAAKLLAELRGAAEVAVTALEARSQAARDRAVAALAQRYDEGERVKEALRGALGSRYRHVRDRAAIELAGKKDPAAFDALVKMLDTDAQAAATDALVRLGDARAPEAFMNRIDKDPAGNARVDALLAAVGSFRAPATVPRLLGYLEERKKRRAAHAALLAVSGFDQATPRTDEEIDAGTAWEDKQHPRRADVLAKLLDALYRLGDADLMRELMPSARWARGGEVDPVLAPLATFAKDDLRHAALGALGFRLRKRKGSAEPLVAALSHPNPATQLLAAEGLALGGRADGIRVLLTAIDLMPELSDRVRAVRALGELGDARALDPLLRLVNEEGHALQEEAAEAIGHLKSTPKGPQIEALLLRLAAGPGGVGRRALVGLRWFDSRAGWDLIRGRAADEDRLVRATVAELLAHDGDPASREALIKRLEEDVDHATALAAARSLRKRDGESSLEPDYLLLRARYSNLEPDTLGRLREKGDAARILELLPKIPSQHENTYVRPLVSALLARSPLPLDAASAQIGSVFERVAAVAAQILGRAGTSAAKAHGKALVEATRKAASAWATARAEVERGVDRLEPQTERYRRMIIAAGKLGVGAEEVIAAASLGGDDPRARAIRIEALTALSTGFAGPAGLDALAAATVGNDGSQRQIAAAALSRLAPDRAASLAAKVLDDRPSVGRLLAGHERDALPTLRQAATRVHTQGVALPLLVQSGDVEGLAAALADQSLGEVARLGVIEALARIATDEAFKPILAVATSKSEDEELRKAAFRGLRRGKRAQKQKQAGREVVR
ncbi:MAG: HEAT repeat domain-containing protein [Byssovorax sp.]